MIAILSKSMLNKWFALSNLGLGPTGKFADSTDTFQEMGDCNYYKVTTCTNFLSHAFEV